MVEINWTCHTCKKEIGKEEEFSRCLDDRCDLVFHVGCAEKLPANPFLSQHKICPNQKCRDKIIFPRASGKIMEHNQRWELRE